MYILSWLAAFLKALIVKQRIRGPGLSMVVTLLAPYNSFSSLLV